MKPFNTLETSIVTDLEKESEGRFNLQRLPFRSAATVPGRSDHRAVGILWRTGY